MGIFIMILLGACREDNPNPTLDVQWKSLGLAGHIVNKLQVAEDKIFAATDKELRHSGNNKSWIILKILF